MRGRAGPISDPSRRCAVQVGGSEIGTGQIKFFELGLPEFRLLHISVLAVLADQRSVAQAAGGTRARFPEHFQLVPVGSILCLRRGGPGN